MDLSKKRPISDADDKIWNDMKPIEADAVEKRKIDELMRYNPKLDYLMALMLIKASDEDLEKIAKQKKERPVPNTSTIIEDAFYFEN